MRLIDADALKNLPFHRLIHTDFGDTAVSFEEIDNAPTVGKHIHIDDVYRLIAGHSDYHGDKILSALTCLTEGKDVSPIEPIDNVPTVEPERPQGELIEYKHLELDYNVKSAVENLKTAYWSNDTEKYAQAFTEAEQIIVNAICHYGYIVMKGGVE